MDETLRRAWVERALAVRKAMVKGVPPEARHRSMLKKDVLQFVQSAGLMGPGWTPLKRTALTDMFDPYPRKGVPFGSDTNRQETKCVRIGYALATGDLSAILPSEVGFLVERGLLAKGRVEPAEKAVERIETGPAFRVDFTVPFLQLRPRATTSRFPARTHGSTSVTRVPSATAPVAWRLPMAEGGNPRFLDVREMDGVLYRPVLRPGSEEPIGEAEFVAASRSEDAWVDSPFLMDAACTLALAEYLREPIAIRKGDEAAPAEAVHAALSRAGRLVSVDGIVHRETKEPTVHVVLRNREGPKPGVTLAWSVDGLWAGRRQVALEGHEPYDYRCRVGRSLRAVLSLAFPGRHLDVASDVGRALAARIGMEFDEGPKMETPTFAATEPVPVVMECLRSAGRDLDVMALRGKGEVAKRAIAAYDARRSPSEMSGVLRDAGRCDALTQVIWRDNFYEAFKTSVLVVLLETAVRAYEGDYRPDEDREEDEAFLCAMTP